MAASDAIPVPRKNAAFRFYFAIRKNDGTLITSWSGQDSEVSKDGGSFADCTNEATEIGTSGCGYLELTSTEMNADSVTLKISVTNTDALPIVVVFYPEESGDYRIASESNITAIKAKTDNLPASPAATSDIATALGTGTWATAIPWNAAWDAEVQSECTDALNAYDPPTNAEMEARTLVAASYATAATQTTIVGHVDTLETEMAKVIKSGESRTIARAGETSITFTETRA